MGLFDSLSGGLKNALGQAEAAAMPALISRVLAKTDLGNMQGLLNKLQQSGLGPQVASWLGDGKNMPITPDQLRTAWAARRSNSWPHHSAFRLTKYWHLLPNIFHPSWIS